MSIDFLIEEIWFLINFMHIVDTIIKIYQPLNPRGIVNSCGSSLITFRIKYGISSQQFSFDIALFTPLYELSDNELLYRLSAERKSSRGLDN